ncbi:MAG: hypothetical protein ACI9JM_002571 [Halioglobus sp.]|jgi:hypothetical protein
MAKRIRYSDEFKQETVGRHLQAGGPAVDFADDPTEVAPLLSATADYQIKDMKLYQYPL